MPLDKQLQRVNFYGFKEVETFLYFGPTNDDPFVFAGSEHDIARILETKKQFDNANLRVKIYHSQYGPRFVLSALDDKGKTEIIKNIKCQIEVATLLGASIMVLHGSSGPKGAYLDHKQKRLAMIKNVLEELEPEAEKNNVKLAVENMIPPAIFANTAELVGVVKQLNSDYINICLDTGHAILFGDVYESIRICGNKLGHIHLHDNNADGDEHAFPFTRSLEEDKFFTVLKDIQYNNDITIEVTRLLDCDDHIACRYKNRLKAFAAITSSKAKENRP